ncbi:hypothetical protein G7Z17_g141 [Cylindrodendrum hubeiense]|uniref:Uncharacterized protein n=1 Tax=Cylindrodendrum hubeiense TaxID=595255 RepID=A0A9P5HLL6_9HYPO|nr:hypothetical protein G7Z17_g141 [Cylindrodendrum hubeiense]
MNKNNKSGPANQATDAAQFLTSTPRSATGSAGRPVGDALGYVGSGVENALTSVGKGVEDAGQGKKQ